MPLARQSSTHDLAQTLAGIDFPADKAKLVEYARSHKATDDLIGVLEKMPDEQYTSMADVFKGIGMSDSSETGQSSRSKS
ncbi:MAG: DUF2795 domain-containing protein [Rhodospirillales bacterium]|nr:DUF2795 domain-containing protein [Rhodospirillales bacterium]